MPFLNLNYRTYRIFTVLYGLLILGLSSIPSSSFPDISIWSWDKLIHGVEYWGFGILLLLSLSRWNYKILSILIISGMAFGAYDEIYQSFIPGRDMDLYDWFADSIGFIVGILSGLYIKSKQDD